MSRLTPEIVLAQIGELTFVRPESAVYVVRPGGLLQFYCLLPDWPTMPAAQEAALREEIAALEARLAELRGRASSALVSFDPTPAAIIIADEPAEDAEVSAALEASFTPPPDEAGGDKAFACPHCARDDFRSERALSGHIGRVHVALARKTAEAPPAAWTCATCGQAVGERSISDPTRCKACVRAANDAAPKASAALAATVARPKAEALAS